METSLYPVSQVISKVIRNSGYTPLGFLYATGHPDVESVLPKLESWLQNGEGDETILPLVAAYDPDEADALYKAVAETADMKAAGVDPAVVEEERKRRKFKAYIFAEGETRVPTQITMFGVTGGHRRWHTIKLPDDVQTMPVEDQLAKLPELMATYKQQHKGLCPFFGKLVGFKFVRYSDYFQFDADGQLLKHVEEPFQHGEGWVELR